MSFYRAVMLGLALLIIVQVADTNAQTVPVMGYVAAKNANPKRLEVFKRGLAELGYIEGKNIRIEYREAVLDAEYDVMADLVDRKIDVIAAANVAATRAAAKATKTIPIVMLAVFDPVGIGVVKSLERPGTNVTGTTQYAPQLVGERLRMLKGIVPNPGKVAMALNANNANNAAQFELLSSEAQKLGMAVESLHLACRHCHGVLLIETSGIPYTIIRSTQFLEFLGGIAASSADGNIVRLSIAYDNRGYHPAASAYDRGYEGAQAVRGNSAASLHYGRRGQIHRQPPPSSCAFHDVI
jgi:hypothetical protein